jgi:hypothetical protein
MKNMWLLTTRRTLLRTSIDIEISRYFITNDTLHSYLCPRSQDLGTGLVPPTHLQERLWYR